MSNILSVPFDKKEMGSGSLEPCSANPALVCGVLSWSPCCSPHTKLGNPSLYDIKFVVSKSKNGNVHNILCIFSLIH